MLDNQTPLPESNPQPPEPTPAPIQPVPVSDELMPPADPISNPLPAAAVAPPTVSQPITSEETLPAKKPRKKLLVRLIALLFAIVLAWFIFQAVRPAPATPPAKIPQLQLPKTPTLIPEDTTEPESPVLESPADSQANETAPQPLPEAVAIPTLQIDTPAVDLPVKNSPQPSGSNAKNTVIPVLDLTE